MPRKTVYDPRWEPYSALVKLYVTPSQRHDLDQLATELRVSRSLRVRQAVEAGLPLVVAELRAGRRRGLRPGGRSSSADGRAASLRRGGRGASVVAGAWHEPAGRDADEPARDYPESDED